MVLFSASANAEVFSFVSSTVTLSFAVPSLTTPTVPSTTSPASTLVPAFMVAATPAIVADDAVLPTFPVVSPFSRYVSLNLVVSDTRSISVTN